MSDFEPIVGRYLPVKIYGAEEHPDLSSRKPAAEFRCYACTPPATIHVNSATS